ncbi:WSC domain-containing protein 4 [Elsinoe australis]|uniref:WSC domain-containing protein 4 n=1 Tax=Elsinoe australis TaxID=40998 RepID=A0A4U7B214_9PEZI|nr:WSC domain-containing protein 4 [Elsinoe australis]
MIGFSIPSTLAFVVLSLSAARVAALTQTYCSNQNTGGNSQSNYSIYQSNGLCFDTCKDQYAFAVVQYQNCWCSNIVPSQQVDVGDCSEQCPGYPDELCGNRGSGLYGYVALSRAPSGTAGGGASRTQSQEQTQSAPSRQRPTFSSEEPSPTTSAAPSSTEPTTTEASSSPTTTDPPSSPPPSPPTTSATPTVTSSSSSSSPPPTVTSIVTLTPTPSSTSSSSSTTSSSESETVAPVTNTQVVTVSGAIVTQTVTSTPRARPSSSATGADNLQERPQQSNTPTGVIVGAVVGSLAGLAFILLALFLLWRRRRSTKRMSMSSGINRNASVLSKAGLLSSARNPDQEKSMEEPRYGSQRQSALYDPPESPISAPSGVYGPAGQPSRRNSRPLVYDQRLNPAALMENWQANSSRTSVGTMQDQRDYSRPLGVTNPDADDRA